MGGEKSDPYICDCTLLAFVNMKLLRNDVFKLLFAMIVAVSSCVAIRKKNTNAYQAINIILHTRVYSTHYNNCLGHAGGRAL